MWRIVIAFGLALSSNQANAAQISASEVQSICQSGNQSCGMYLSGIYEGIIETMKYDRSRLVCAPSPPSSSQLREYFLVTLTLAGTSYAREPAAEVAFVAFMTAMPCK